MVRGGGNCVKEEMKMDLYVKIELYLQRIIVQSMVVGNDDYTYTKRYYELSDHGLTVVMEATLLLEEIYNQILLDSDADDDEVNLQIYEIN